MSDEIKPDWTGVRHGTDAVPLCVRGACPAWQDGMCQYGASVRLVLANDRACGEAVKRMRKTLLDMAEPAYPIASPRATRPPTPPRADDPPR